MRRRCCCVSNKCSAKFSYEHSSDDCETCFTDLSTASSGCTVNGWSWLFSDGDTSTAQNPCHTFDLQNSPIPPWARLTISTSCGNECTIQNNLNIPCQDAPSVCYPSAQESLPKHWRVDLSGMYAKGLGGYQVIGTLSNVPIEDNFNRILCIGLGVTTFSTADLSVLNGSWEIPWLAQDITGTHGYATTMQNTLYQTYTWTFTNVPRKNYIIQSVLVPAWIQVFTDFNCDSIGPLTRDIGCVVWNVFTNIGQISYSIADYRKTVTLPAGMKLKEYGPIEMDPIPYSFGAISTAGRPLAWEYAYNNPNCTPSNGASPIAYPTCVITPNG